MNKPDISYLSGLFVYLYLKPTNMAELITENIVTMTKEFVKGEIKNMLEACKKEKFEQYNKNFHVFVFALHSLINDVTQDEVTEDFSPYFVRLRELNQKYALGEITGWLQFTQIEILAYIGDDNTDN